MTSRRAFICASVAVVCASPAFAAARDDIDPAYIDYGPRGTPEGALETGTVFGSVGIVPPAGGVSAVSLHMIPLEGGRHKIEIFAANRKTHPNWRQPDVDTEVERVWAFSGTVPEGHYLIRLMGVTVDDERDIRWIEISPALELVVRPNAGMYVGRWQLTRPDIEVPEPKVQVEGQPLVLRDAMNEDRGLLTRRGRAVPRDVDDGPAALMGPRI